LGLAISKALIEAYGGTIEPHSRVGEGTRMVVCLPV
jgi:signal transduction histidine kinase